MKSFFQFLSEARVTQASLQASKIGLVGDGHGGWLNRSGKLVAKTEDGKLKFLDGRGGAAARKPDESQQAAAAAPSAQQVRPQVSPIPSAPQAQQREPEKPEKDDETITVVFGRFNPPTKGQKKLLTMAKKISAGGEFKVYPSRIQDPKMNPLNPDTKIYYMRKMFPDFEDNIINDPYMKTIFDVLISSNEQGFDNVNIVVGSERQAEIQNLAQKHNGELYNFNIINVVPAGVPDVDASSTIDISPSKMRKAVMDNNFELFRRGVPKTLNDGEAKAFYDEVRLGMGIKKKVRKESYNLWEIAPKFDMKNLRETYIRGDIFKIGSKVQNLNTGLIGEVTRRGTNYLICVTEEGYMFKSWIKDLIEYTEVKMNSMYREPGKPNTLVGTDGYLKYAVSMTPGAKLGINNLQIGGKPFLKYINKVRKTSK